ncbi:hypothetical protein [Rhodococcus phage REQ1]|uniref:hypothetical protein n=1 Tax=Rhodococcus phage REQ1 TaxID=1109712 RepID=UPI00023EEC02|nr:hypothetical protein RoPhREQ1_gp33 [Rhodococcus phage REQ1]AEV52029.1 hypothetical protein [Rhodococcus phage REQ1]
MTTTPHGKLIATTGDGTHPKFETENFPIDDPVWVLAFTEDGSAVSMFKESRSYEWALSALRRIEEVLMRQAGWFDRLDLDTPDDEVGD